MHRLARFCATQQGGQHLARYEGANCVGLVCAALRQGVDDFAESLLQRPQLLCGEYVVQPVFLVIRDNAVHPASRSSKRVAGVLGFCTTSLIFSLPTPLIPHRDQ